MDVVDQTLSFELLGTKKNYQLFCRGTCAFPTIVTNPKTIFPRLRKTSIKSDEIVSKQYAVPESTFYFGPLLVGKTRERYQEGRYPENMEKLTLFNEGPLTAELSFAFKKDATQITFLLDPPNLILPPNSKKDLRIWAYPKQPGNFQDSLVCCIKDNPEPVTFDIQ